jgi:hypothetical protein
MKKKKLIVKCKCDALCCMMGPTSYCLSLYDDGTLERLKEKLSLNNEVNTKTIDVVSLSKIQKILSLIEPFEPVVNSGASTGWSVTVLDYFHFGEKRSFKWTHNDDNFYIKLLSLVVNRLSSEFND